MLTLSRCSIITSFLRSVDTDTARFCCNSKTCQMHRFFTLLICHANWTHYLHNVINCWAISNNIHINNNILLVTHSMLLWWWCQLADVDQPATEYLILKLNYFWTAGKIMSTCNSTSLWATPTTEVLKHGPCLMGSHRVTCHLHVLYKPQGQSHTW